MSAHKSSSAVCTFQRSYNNQQRPSERISSAMFYRQNYRTCEAVLQKILHTELLSGNPLAIRAGEIQERSHHVGRLT
jgi:hypothetical protein